MVDPDLVVTYRVGVAATDWEGRGFTGGETMILKPHVLDYWRSFQPGQGLEERHFLDLVEPRFNRLTVFDPRFPHGVRAVTGTRDPLKARLVSSSPALPPANHGRSPRSLLVSLGALKGEARIP